jgi:hypothetical protein
LATRQELPDESRAVTLFALRQTLKCGCTAPGGLDP